MHRSRLLDRPCYSLHTGDPAHGSSKRVHYRFLMALAGGPAEEDLESTEETPGAADVNEDPSAVNGSGE